jgi:hypothetical protein
MASNVLNPGQPLDSTANSAPVIPRAKAVTLGTLLANSDVLQFVLTPPGEGHNGLDALLIVTAGGTVTAGLEGSVDGTNWFGVLPRAASGTAPNLSGTTLNSDTAASSANLYDVSGLQGGVVFRFGGRSAGSPVVTVLFP